MPLQLHRRIPGLLLAGALALCGPQALPAGETDTGDEDKALLSIGELHSIEDILDGEEYRVITPDNSDFYWYYSLPDSGFFQDTATVFRLTRERHNLWLPFRSVGEIPDGYFILGPYIPDGYLQHQLDIWPIGSQSGGRIKTTIEFDDSVD